MFDVLHHAAAVSGAVPYIARASFRAGRTADKGGGGGVNGWYIPVHGLFCVVPACLPIARVENNETPRNAPMDDNKRTKHVRRPRPNLFTHKQRTAFETQHNAHPLYLQI